MLQQAELYERFLALHSRDGGFIMPNSWDGLSALVLKKAGFEALGTSSAALAASLGRLDGRHAVSLQEHLNHGVLMSELSGLPVNGDFEDGYGSASADVAATVEAAIAAGLAGVGIEDTTGDPANPIRPFDEAVERVRAAAKVAKGRIVLTGRSDNFIQGRPDLADTIRRLTAFAEVGADVLYAPYPSDLDAVRAIVKAVAPKPVNLVVGTRQGAVSWQELQQAGVKRLSLGVSLYLRAFGALQEAAAQLASGDIRSAAAGMAFGDVKTLIAELTPAPRAEPGSLARPPSRRSGQNQSSMARIDTASVLVAATAEACYRAFSDAHALISWLPPGDMSGRALEYDFREGGRYRIELTYAEHSSAAVGKTQGRTDVSTGRFLELEPGRRIVQSVEFESADTAFRGQMTMTWSFEALPEGTRISIVAKDVPPGISKADHDAGMRSSLANLKRFLAADRT